MFISSFKKSILVVISNVTFTDHGLVVYIKMYHTFKLKYVVTPMN